MRNNDDTIDEEMLGINKQLEDSKKVSKTTIAGGVVGIDLSNRPCWLVKVPPSMNKLLQYKKIYSNPRKKYSN